MIFYIPGFLNDKPTMDAISSLDFVDFPLGGQVKDFSYLPDQVVSRISEILQRKILVTESIFRRPYSFIHYEEFTPNTIFSCAIAFRQSKFTLWKEKETGCETIFEIHDVQEFVNNKCFDRNNWEELNTIKMNPGDLLMFKSWSWHSFEGLIQVFRIEQNGL